MNKTKIVDMKLRRICSFYEIRLFESVLFQVLFCKNVKNAIDFLGHVSTVSSFQLHSEVKQVA